MNLEVDQHPAGLSKAAGQLARSIRTFREALAYFIRLHLTVDFYVLQSSPFDVIIVLAALKALQTCWDFGFQQGTLVPGSKKATLLLEYAVVDVTVHASLQTDSEDFSSNSDGALDVNEDSTGDLYVATPVDVHHCSDTCSTFSFSGSSGDVSAVEKKLSGLDKRF